MTHIHRVNEVTAKVQDTRTSEGQTNVLPLADIDFLSERFTRRISIHLSHGRDDAARQLLEEAIKHRDDHKRNPESATVDCLPMIIVEELGFCGIHKIKDAVGRLDGIGRLTPNQKRLVNTVCMMQGAKKQD